MTKPAYELVDPRPFAKEAPYTFFLPSPRALAAVRPGDKVYLDFCAVPARTKWESERMWVVVREISHGRLRGVLDHEPDDMPGLSRGDVVDFELWHILQLDFAEPVPEGVFDDDTREYWERCLVDEAILTGELKVEYLYREEPDPARAGDPYPDSGWRFRGDMRGCTDEQVQEREATYIALGKVLNQDDSWLHLIDEPVGSAFERDWETGEFEPVES